MLTNLLHRGACGSDATTGDGAGILIQVPDRFFRAVLPFAPPEPGAYGVGLVFLPRDPAHRVAIESLIARIVDEGGQRLRGWRDVPTDGTNVDRSAMAVAPAFRQIFVGAEAGLKTCPTPAGDDDWENNWVFSVSPCPSPEILRASQAVSTFTTGW